MIFLNENSLFFGGGGPEQFGARTHDPHPRLPRDLLLLSMYLSMYLSIYR